MSALDETHDPALRSWVDSAQQPDGDFPIQNLPFGVFARDGAPPRCGVRIGDRVLDLAAAAKLGLVDDACAAPSLNRVMGLPVDQRRALRRRLSELLRHGARDRATVEPLLVAVSQVRMALPAVIGDYSDFYASIHHATNIGSMLRPDNPLMPNYKHIPIGYHGRSSSIVVSGAAIRRPRGQLRNDAEKPPEFAPTARLDYEVEIGAFIAEGNALGTPIPIARADEQVFGFCLLNDWSARDIQGWEYQPLGPFLAKSFATSISPWVVTREALLPFRVPPHPRSAGDPQPLPYLRAEADQREGAIDLTLDAELTSAAMRAKGLPPLRLSRASMRDLYWTTAQMVAHHASNGCNLRPGDLLGSGTISGVARESWGSLMELAWRGTKPLELPGGEKRAWLADGDEVVLRGFAQRDGRARIGLGECRAVVQPAVAE